MTESTTIEQLHEALRAVTAELEDARAGRKAAYDGWEKAVGELAAMRARLPQLIQLGREDADRWRREAQSRSDEAIITEWDAQAGAPAPEQAGPGEVVSVEGTDGD